MATKIASKTAKVVASTPAPKTTKKVASKTPKLDALTSQGVGRREWDSELAESLSQEFAEVYGPKLGDLSGSETIDIMRKFVRFTGYKHLFRALKDAGY